MNINKIYKIINSWNLKDSFTRLMVEDTSWKNEDGNQTVSVKELDEVKNKILQKINQLHELVTEDYLYRGKANRGIGMNTEIINFYRCVPDDFENESFNKIETIKKGFELCMDNFVEQLIRKYDLPHSVSIVLDEEYHVDLGGGYSKQMIKFEVI